MSESDKIEQFQKILWRQYAEHGRHGLPWRQPESDGSFDPYKILVSELMLQQTQVARVVPKYLAFLEQFPDVKTLATAELGTVLKTWSGLGYNRRAKYLWQTASEILDYKHNDFPNSITELVKLPGIGINTAGAILAYAFNQPVVFVETNVRTVIIHHFFRHQTEVTDEAIRQIIRLSLDEEHPREYYWALMDYGSRLKQTTGSLNKLSKHYTKQSIFSGSKRETRGKVLRILGERPHSHQELLQKLASPWAESVLQTLLAEGLIHHTKGRYYL